MLDPAESPRLSAAFADRVAMAELTSRKMSRVIVGCAPVAETRFAQLDVESHLFLELRGIAIAQNEKPKSPEELEQHAHAMQGQRSTAIEPP